MLKEGPAEDHANREAIAKLLRFASTLYRPLRPDRVVEDYVSPMKESGSVPLASPQTAMRRKKTARTSNCCVRKASKCCCSRSHRRVDDELPDRRLDGKAFQSVAVPMSPSKTGG
ncbi:hypothetical protein KCP77_19710 [Salmonella enterica subsp. enterica]|nr:hypothetical protein KCP77_19710 [Salmonella enterica subsp. enterica]